MHQAAKSDGKLDPCGMPWRSSLARNRFLSQRGVDEDPRKYVEDGVAVGATEGELGVVLNRAGQRDLGNSLRGLASPQPNDELDERAIGRPRKRAAEAQLVRILFQRKMQTGPLDVQPG